MVATNLKGETMSLMEKRTKIEEEMNSIISRLCQPGGPGLSGNLLDSEGFPRSDIDIPSVRAERHRLAELRNDHKQITDKIDENIQILHSARLGAKSSSVADSGNKESSNSQNTSVNDVTSSSSTNIFSRESASPMDVDFAVTVPFAMVDEIADESPASEDGLQLGDQIVKFGSVEAGENLRERLASEAQRNQGRAISLVVLRQGAAINLTITPRTWRGRGLLGCHFQML